MGDCPNALQQEHIKAIATLENDVDTIYRKINDLSDIKDAVVELKVLQQEQVKSNKKFEKLYEETMKQNLEITSTLKIINENLNSLNKQVNSANERIDGIEEKIEQIDEKSKVDLMVLFKQYAIPAILGGGIVYFILTVVGKI
jgi:predicted nuclease with TOPRIM domain